MSKSDDNHWGSGYTVAGTVVRRDGGFLLVQERQKRAYKLWNLPAGKVDEGESIEEAAVRETKEETGFVVEVIRPLCTRDTSGRPVLHSFEARIVGGSLQVEEAELFDARFFTLEEIEVLAQNNEIRDPWVVNSIKQSFT